MSGLEFMQGILAGEIPSAPISKTLNYRLVHVSDGKVIWRGTPEFSASNPFGAPHGGWYATILDSAVACAVMTKVPKGSVYTTLELKLNITRAAPLGTDLEATGTVQHAGRSTGVAVGEVRGVEDGKLYATASTTCIIMTP